VDEEQGIYRSEVQDILGALADIRMAVLRVLSYIEGDDDEEEAEEDRPSDARGASRVRATLESLLRTYERLEIELATGKRPPPDADLGSAA
jgi:hypothetical protein